MLCRIFQGSNPIAASTTPTRTESRISRNATASGEPPRKRDKPSLLAGKSLTSLGIDLSCGSRPYSTMAESKWGTHDSASMAAGLSCGNAGFALQHPFQRFEPVGLARRLVPAQPADAREPHRDAGFVPRRARQPLERDFQYQPLI